MMMRNQFDDLLASREEQEHQFPPFWQPQKGKQQKEAPSSMISMSEKQEGNKIHVIRKGK
mgnify:FL=1